MSTPIKQHLIDPEICIRCYTCENTCPIQAIEHDDNNVVVDASKCNFCMDCIPVCPTGSIDEWRVVAKPYSLEEQFDWDELPEQDDDIGLANVGSSTTESDDSSADGNATDPIQALLAAAHSGAGGKSIAPATATKPTVNLYNLGNPVQAVVQGNYRITAEDSDSDVRHIVIDFQGKPFPAMEGQSVGIIAPGLDADGKAHLPRLYSVSSPRDGEREGYHNVSLTVKRESQGVCSNYLCDLKIGERLQVTGPFGATFLMPNDPASRLLMICTGTGSAPMRSFTMARQRLYGTQGKAMTLFFGARTPDSLPYFGPLQKLPSTLLQKHLVYSRVPEVDKEYVQDRLRSESTAVTELLLDSHTHVYICGLKEMEEGVEAALRDIASEAGRDWYGLRTVMREEGRFHVETY